MKSRFQVNVTMVANEFIDEYMVAANGEYVKVYLYILRHDGEPVTVDMIADALNNTESDVKRAITYWEKAGALLVNSLPKTAGSPGKETAATTPVKAVPEREAQKSSEERASQPGEQSASMGTSVADKKIPQARPVYSPDQVSRLAEEEDFTQLLYIAQKYMNKVFTPRECELFAYLYDGLHIPSELLEYLVEYCVQGGHSNIRYMETVAINWHEKGIKTVDAAKAHTASYTKDGFAVMKAFGLNDRKPGEPEIEMIKRWFKEYGFTKDVVVEACNRTLAAIHNPSFQYADKILSEWRKAGVRHLSDIQTLDEKRKTAENRSTAKQVVAPKTGKNQFHNFEQRDTNYDAMVLERLKERLGEQ